jgi:hypothetical protein
VSLLLLLNPTVWGEAPGQTEYPSEPVYPLTAEAVRALITADVLAVDFGADLLDTSDQLVEDISADLASGEIERQNYADIHGTCRLEISRALDWRHVRIRPWQQLTGAGWSERWPLGIYLPTTPERPIGETPATYQVQGYDKISLLTKPVGDTYVVAAGTGYLAAVAQAITDSGATGLAPLIDQAAAETTLAAPMVWVLDESGTTYLRVINDLLKAVGYRGLYCDAAGRYRSEPYQTPASRAPIWTLDASDKATIVGQERIHRRENWSPINWWRFVRRGMTTTPVEDAGLYTVDESGAEEQYRSVVFLDVADQAALVAEGERIVQEQRQIQETLDITTGPLPLLGHFDVMRYVDPEGLLDAKVQVQSWIMPLDGGDVTLKLEVV